MAHFESKVTIRAAAADVFDFLTCPEHVRQTLPADSGLAYVNVPDRLFLGSRCEFKLSGFGPAQQIIHEVVEFSPPRRFVESQVAGPLGRFVHEHIVEPVSADYVEVVDAIEFEPPGGLARFLVTEDRIRKSLETGFEHRHRELKRILESRAEEAVARLQRPEP